MQPRALRADDVKLGEAMHDREAYARPLEEVVARVETSLERGLSSEEARKRLEALGANELAQEERVSPVRLFLAQFKNTLIVILLVATVLSAVLGEIVDAAIIAVIVLFCAVLSFVQEYRADNALKALKKMLAPTISVLRDGAQVRVPSRELVPGDVMLLEAGDRIPADARLAEIHSLKCDEAALTGRIVRRREIVAPAAEGCFRRRPPQRRLRRNNRDVRPRQGDRDLRPACTPNSARSPSRCRPSASSPRRSRKRTAEVGRWLGIIALVVCAVTIVVSVVRAWMGDELNLSSC
jgi:Ca2+-transporting ATPase